MVRDMMSNDDHLRRSRRRHKGYVRRDLSRFLWEWFQCQVTMRERWGFNREELIRVWENVSGSDTLVWENWTGYREGKRRLVEALDNLPMPHTRLLQWNQLTPMFERDVGDLEELKQSIRQVGVVQPLVVRSIEGQDTYEIVIGYRRWSAVRELRLTGVSLPCIVKEIGDATAYQLSATENNQRKSWNPMEEAQHYRAWLGRFNLTEQQIAVKISKSREYVANRLRLLNLPGQVTQYISEGRLTPDHGIALLSLPDAQSQIQQANISVEERLTVRQLRSQVRAYPQVKVAFPPSSGSDCEALLQQIAQMYRSKRQTECVGCSLKEHCVKLVKVV